MATKENFSKEEWTLLLLAPTYASTYVITADMSVVGALREMKAMANAIMHHEPPADARELANAVIADIQARSKEKQGLEGSPTEEGQEGQDGREPAREGLRQAAGLLDAKCPPEEGAGFKQWLLDIAQAVAEADKEGSHFGMGGVRVTDKEQAALAEIKSFLGL